ncbi:aldo/keto reductase [Spirulina sp. CS-785/01]|uniref:aldo/keto reductase n=1 Tax=Spirulina sp. CS-785/01 TaxID=3021716 RepID=UPI00232C200C|nr:aldo/keto reductase [Spirulina sp. CS-785/01]MDB9313428.1 aldo/keto reductase [Spirulina sp. CS-785/01]
MGNNPQTAAMNTQAKTIADSIILGCWQLDDRSWKSLTEEDIERTIGTYQAWGVRIFDTADIYGRSERLLGKCLKGRTDCKIYTKAVFFNGLPTPKQIQSKVENSLRNLQRDYLDCLQVHWHNPQLDFAETFKVLNRYLEQGKIHQLGVTNFDTLMLKKALEYAPIQTHQVQYSLIDRRVEKSMQELCVENNIQLLCYGPLAGGFLSDKFLGVKSPPAEGEHARGFYYSNMIAKHGDWQGVQTLLSKMAEIGKKYQFSVSQVALNWLIQQPGVGAMISGLTENRQQIQKNMESLQPLIRSEDIQELSRCSDELFEQVGDIYSYERGV